MTIIIFLLVLSTLILVHEFGHFIVAKLAGIKVEEFGLGLPFPPKIFSIKRGETTYSLYALFFGGFVRLYGEERAEKVDHKRAFSSRSKKIRAAVITAGVVMNFLLAIVAFSILYSILGVPRASDKVKVVGIAPGSPAQVGGLEIDRQILSVEGQEVRTKERFIEIVDQKRGKEIVINLRSDAGEVKEVRVTPRANPPQGEGPLGVAITDSEQYFPPWYQRPFVGAWYGLQEALSWSGRAVFSVVLIFKTLFTTATLPGELAGPVGIFQITQGFVAQGGLAVLWWMGVLSVNLAILNIVPFPALDGGRLLFVGIEAILGRRAGRLLPKIEQVANMVGFALLITLLLAITLQDIRRLLG